MKLCVTLSTQSQWHFPHFGKSVALRHLFRLSETDVASFTLQAHYNLVHSGCDAKGGFAFLMSFRMENGLQYSTPNKVRECFEGRVGAISQTGDVPTSHFQRQNALILACQEVAHGDL